MSSRHTRRLANWWSAWRRKGVLSKETHETVIRFAPPLTISKALIDRAVEIFRQVIARNRKSSA
jgi:acetylornithine/succinyldiaminopimelate/putrescine aminotransferase